MPTIFAPTAKCKTGVRSGGVRMTPFWYFLVSVATAVGSFEISGMIPVMTDRMGGFGK